MPRAGYLQPRSRRPLCITLHNLHNEKPVMHAPQVIQG